MKSAARPGEAGWPPSLALLGLALAGQGASLSLIDAPPYGVFQHYRAWEHLFSDRPVGLAILALQTLCCCWLARGCWRSLFAGLLRLAPGWRLPVAAVFLGTSAAVPTVGIARYAGEIALASWVSAIALLNLVLFARSLPAGSLARVGAWLSTRLTLDDGRAATRAWDRRLPWLAAAWVLGITSFIAVVVLDGIPHIDDDIVYLFQAKYYALGRLWLPRPPDVDSFSMTHLILQGGKWYGKFFPGWPIVLAAGVLAGAPALVNPLLAAASVLLTHDLLRRAFGLRMAHGVVLLLALSPWFLALSATLMAHTASLFWTLLALVAVERLRGRAFGVWALVCGLSLGMLFLTRPFDAAIGGPVVGLWALGLGGRRLSIASIAAIGISAALVASLYFPYNAALTGSPLLAPHRLWSDALFGPGADVLGFGPRVGIFPLMTNLDPLPGHGLPDVVLNTNKNLQLVGFELFGWAAGSLVLATLAFLSPRWRWSDFPMLALGVGVIAAHAAYWASGGPDFGPRYWHLAIVPLCVFTVRGAEIAAERLGSPQGTSEVIAARVVAAILAASLGALVLVLPWRCVGKYDSYRGISREIAQLAAERGIEGGIVFVRSARKADYQAAFSFEPAEPSAPENVFARDAGEAQRAATLLAYPNRPVWLIGRRSAEDRALGVLAGPLPPGTNPAGAALGAPEPLQATLPCEPTARALSAASCLCAGCRACCRRRTPGSFALRPQPVSRRGSSGEA